MRNKGALIVFEGGDAVGKSTQIKYLTEYLKKKKLLVVQSREPGGGDKKIRQKLLSQKLTPQKELDLFLKDRALHIKKIIQPALSAGKIVILDRFSPSTIAYQGYGRRLNISEVIKKDKKIRQGVEPDLIILLDADPEKILKRKKPDTHFETEKIAFHKRVRNGYLIQARQNPSKWRIIKADFSRQSIRKKIIKIIDLFLKQKYY